jgi:hypothetical protein
MLGDGTTANSATPVSVQDVTSATALAATGELSLSGHSCILSGAGVSCWGMNYHGELGNGSTVASNVPVTAVGLEDARSVALGAFQSLAITGSGVVRWGIDLATEKYLTTAVRLNGLEDATALSESPRRSRRQFQLNPTTMAGFACLS